MRAAIVGILVSSTAFAEPAPTDLRVGLVASLMGQHSNLATDVSKTPGPGVFVDWVKRSEQFAFGAHLGWSSSFNNANLFGAAETTFQQLIEAHALFEWRHGAVSLGGSVGLDVLNVRGSYSDMNGDPDHTDKALGVRAHVAVDVGSISNGTFAVTGSASLFSLLHASGACGGDLSCADQATSFTVGVAFRPR